MAISKCIKCDNTRFELKEATPNGSNFTYQFVQCTKCGGVIGVVDFYNIGDLIQRFAEESGISIKR